MRVNLGSDPCVLCAGGLGPIQRTKRNCAEAQFRPLKILCLAELYKSVTSRVCSLQTIYEFCPGIQAGLSNTMTTVALPEKRACYCKQTRILRAIEGEGDNRKTRDFPVPLYVLWF